MVELRELVLQGEGGRAYIDLNKVLRFVGRLYVTEVGGFIQLILLETHDSRYSIHPDITVTTSKFEVETRQKVKV